MINFTLIFTALHKNTADKMLNIKQRDKNKIKMTENNCRQIQTNNYIKRKYVL